MPSYSRKISIKGKKSEEIYGWVSKDIEKFMKKTPITNFEIKRDDKNKSVTVESKMVTMTLSCKEGGLEIEGKLSLLASPFKGKIDEGIDRWLSKYTS